MFLQTVAPGYVAEEITTSFGESNSGGFSDLGTLTTTWKDFSGNFQALSSQWKPVLLDLYSYRFLGRFRSGYLKRKKKKNEKVIANFSTLPA